MINIHVFLSEEVNASMGFFDEDSNPITTSNDVIVTLIDINGDFVTGGTGTFNIGDNLYHFTFTMPEDAVLSTDTAKYSINWLLIDDVGKEYSSSEYFDVRHPNFNEVSSKEIQLLALENTDVLISQAFNIDTTISVEVYFNGTSTVIGDATKGPEYNGYYIYSITVPKENLNVGQNLVLFKYGNTIFHKKLNIIPLYALLKISDMRMYLDKVHKDTDLYVGYRDSDLYFYLEQGIQLINSLTPITSWTLDLFSQIGQFKDVGFFPVYAGCFQALTAQYLAEGDSAFEYSGQPVNLSVDRTQYIETIKSQLWEFLNTQVKQFKVNQNNLNQTFGLSMSYPGVNGLLPSIHDLRHRGIPLLPLTRS